jgi:hypothetical protein
VRIALFCAALSAVGLLGCDETGRLSQVEAPLSTPTCASPLDYLPPGGSPTPAETTAAFQAMIDDLELQGGGEACIPAGLYELAPTGTSGGAYSVDFDGSADIWFHGQGPATVLRQTGETRTWSMLRIHDGAGRIVISDLTVDGLGVTDTDPPPPLGFPEQTHLVGVNPGASDVTLQRVLFSQSRRGDCLRLVGAEAQPVEHVRVLDSTFIGCHRSGIAVQRGVNRVEIDGSVFMNTGDQEIDFEPSDNPFVGHFVITNNLILHGNSIVAVTLSGSKTEPRFEPHSESVFAGNVVVGAVDAVTVARLEIRDNLLLAGLGEAPNLYLHGKVDDVSVRHNLVLRPAGSFTTNALLVQHRLVCVEFVPNSDPRVCVRSEMKLPRGIDISDNLVVQGIVHDAIRLESVSEASIQGNQIVQKGSDDATVQGPFGIVVRGVTSAGPVDLIQIVENRIQVSGSSGNGIFFHGDNASAAVEVAQVADNVVRAPKVAFRCDGTVSRPILVRGNYFDTATGIACVNYTTGPNAGTP